MIAKFVGKANIYSKVNSKMKNQIIVNMKSCNKRSLVLQRLAIQIPYLCFYFFSFFLWMLSV